MHEIDYEWLIKETRDFIFNEEHIIGFKSTNEKTKTFMGVRNLLKNEKNIDLNFEELKKVLDVLCDLDQMIKETVEDELRQPMSIDSIEEMKFVFGSPTRIKTVPYIPLTFT